MQQYACMRNSSKTGQGPTSKSEVGKSGDALELGGLCDHFENAILEASIVGIGLLEVQVGWQGLVLI